MRARGRRSAASASEGDITSPVTLRVKPAGTCELIALCGNCGLDTEPEQAVPLDSCVETVAAQTTWSSHQLLTFGDNVVLRARYPCSKICCSSI